MYLTTRHLPRRTVLKSLGATIALPFLDAMVPAGTASAREAADGGRRVRLVAMEMVHGAAGSTNFGAKRNLLQDDMKPLTSQEFTVGLDHELSRVMSAGVRYQHKTEPRQR